MSSDIRHGCISALCSAALLIATVFLLPHMEGEARATIAEANTVVVFSGTLIVPAGLVRHYRITPEDCLLDLAINDRKVSLGERFCNRVEERTSDAKTDVSPKIFRARNRSSGVLGGKILDLRGYVHAGENIVQAHVRSGPAMASLDIDPVPTDPVIIAWIAACSLAIAWMLHGFLRRSIDASIAFFPVLAATALRIGYFVATPYDVRGYDISGHVDYLRFLLTNHALPNPAASWEWYQPPLYYVILAALHVDGLAHAVQMRVFQTVGLLASFGTYVLCAVILCRIIPAEMKRMRTLALTLLAAFPGLVFFAARINNDVLLQVLSFGVVAFLVMAMRRPDRKLWIAAAAALGLAILAKENAYVLVPVLGGSLLCARISRTEKRHILAAVVITLAATTGWYYLCRSATPAGFIPNAHGLPSELRIGRSLHDLTAFSPRHMLAIPFNNPWDDAAGRQEFPEYFFRSAFFGEFAYPLSLMNLARAILALAMLCLPLILYGCASAIRRSKPEYVPLLLTLFFGLLMHAAFRFLYPFASSGDFRYSTILTLPAAIFLVIGIAALPPKLRIAAETIGWALAGLMSAFLLAVTFG